MPDRGTGTTQRPSAFAGVMRYEARQTVIKKSEVKVVQSCPTLCEPIDCTVHGILQARILEWVAVPFSRGSSQPRD